MKVLFYRYNSIVEPFLIEAFKKFQIEVVEIRLNLHDDDFKEEEAVSVISDCLKRDVYIFVFSINFFPTVSEVCKIHNAIYVSWTVDCPILQLFSPSLRNKCNRVFMFDRTQYNYFREKNIENIFYLPLATNVKRFQSIIEATSQQRKNEFASDISFVGSLYTEKNPYSLITGLSDYTKGYVDGIIEAQLGIYGYNFIEDVLNERVMEDFTKHVPDLRHGIYQDYQSPTYIIANEFIGTQITALERESLLSAIALRFADAYSVDLYTLSDASKIPLINCKGEANTISEMPLIFNNTRINLNITFRAIQTGLSLRVYDVLGCGGFLLTNYQEELPEIYEPGKEIETFSSKEELLDKVDFYLKNESARVKIARAGYERTLACHTYEHRIEEMIKLIFSTLNR